MHAKAMRCGDLDAAKSINVVKDALSAKRIGDKIQSNEQWNDTCENVMTEISENKCVQVQIFCEKLGSVKKGAAFVESTYNDKWGSGLHKTGTENTKISSMPSKNMLRQIIQKVAKKNQKEEKECSVEQGKANVKIQTRLETAKHLQNAPESPQPIGLRILFWHRCLIRF